MTPALRWILVSSSLAVLASASCAFDFDRFDPRLGSGGSAATVGSGGTAVGGGSSSSAAGGSSSSSAGGAGGMMPALVDRGLLTRYYLDEAASDMGPTMALDAAPMPLDLPISYDGGAGGGGPNMSYIEVMGQRGLTWFAKNSGGSAAIAVANTKLVAFDGATQATIECVVEASDAGGNGVCGRISQLGNNNNGSLTLCMPSAGVASFRLNTVRLEEWSVDFPNLGRTVLHAVFDTNLADPEDRVRLFVNGAPQGIGTIQNAPPVQGDAVVLTGDYVLGNRVVNDGSIVGTIYYCALYTVAFDDTEVANNAALLALDDDTP